MATPMHFKLDLLVRENDSMWHQVSMSVPTVSHTEMIATVKSTGYRNATVTEVDRFGSLDVDPVLQERVMIEMFPTLVSRMLEYDGDRITYQSADLEPWIRGRFSPEEAEVLLKAIADAVPPGKHFETVCLIDIN